MADRKENREQENKRKFDAALAQAREQEAAQKNDGQNEEKKSMFRRAGEGNFGRYGKMAMLGAALAHPAGPKGADAFKDEASREQGDRQVTEERMQQGQNLQDAIFGDGAQLSEQTNPHSYSFGNESNQPQDQSLNNEQQNVRDFSAARKAATVGQVGGRTVQGVSKGAEVAAKGTEAASRGIKKGGQAMTRAGAELSSSGVGAIAGVPMMVAGGAMTAGGAAGEAASKGVQKGAQATGRLGKNVADASKEAKKQSKAVKGLPKPDSGEPSSGMPYMDLARKLREEKRKAMKGDIAGVVGDVVDTASQLTTARILSWAWIALIPSFGLTLLYLNVHLIARGTSFKDKFCKFGSEWALRKAGGSSQAAGPLDEASDMLGRVEIGAIIALDILLAGIIVFLYLGLNLLYCISTNPLNVFDPSSCF